LGYGALSDFAREAIEAAPQGEDAEILEAWADGGSVQVRAVSVFGDPADLSSDEARDFARRILDAADKADAE